MKTTFKKSRFFFESSPFTLILCISFLVVSALGKPLYAEDLRDSNLAFAFASRNPEALVVINKYFKEGDYLSVLIANEMPELGSRIGKSKQFKLSASLAAVADWANRPCNDSKGAGIIIYDNEEWDATPVDERVDIPKSIGQGADMVKASGCRAYGLAPARSFLSKQRGCNPSPSDLNYQINWKRVEVLVIQAQGLLSEKCVRENGLKSYVNFISDIAKIAKKNNPKINIIGEVSFNRSTSEIISQAIDRVIQFVDGIYLAYPQDGSCTYCSPLALEKVLSRYRQPAVNVPIQ